MPDSGGAPPITFVLAPIDQGVRNLNGRPGTAQAPARLLDALRDRGAVPQGAHVHEIDAGNSQRSLEADLQLLSDAVARALDAGRFPLVLGGDHGTTYATVRGAQRALTTVSVTYLDVHFDMRGFRPRHTSGSSFRRLVEEGLVAPSNVHPLGIQRPGTAEALERSGYQALEAWAGSQGVPWRSLAQVRETGVATSVDQAMTTGPAACFSFDVDCLDERWAPGVSAPGGDRFSLDEAVAAVEAAAPLARVFDVVEFAPRLDDRERTLESTVAVIEAFLDVRASGT